MEYYNDIKMEDTEGRVGKKNRKLNINMTRPMQVSVFNVRPTQYSVLISLLDIIPYHD